MSSEEEEERKIERIKAEQEFKTNTTNALNTIIADVKELCGDVKEHLNLIDENNIHNRAFIEINKVEKNSIERSGKNYTGIKLLNRNFYIYGTVIVTGLTVLSILLVIYK